jgi:hypothetical protein
MVMFRKTMFFFFAFVMLAMTVSPDEAFATDGGLHRNAGKRGLLPAGLPRAHYKYRTTIVSGPPVPYDARPYAYGRYGYAPYINSYGIPAAVVIDPVDPATLWRRPFPYGTPFYATPYSCFYYGNC